ncbi:hypothetical protein BS50DRAFT_627740 [Corynespora cassiicola Philippines]|uniref:Uncharacterized protein n=1 Tax=Corynespora cassiicola Philippines TaxID=1448308 RepID=A0A2T2P9S7_CORCC|nr:hypothetical protein BS50DRAFT_627740 [Corynespora cassiicola Philippines]
MAEAERAERAIRSRYAVGWGVLLVLELPLLELPPAGEKPLSMGPAAGRSLSSSSRAGAKKGPSPKAPYLPASSAALCSSRSPGSALSSASLPVRRQAFPTENPDGRLMAMSRDPGGRQTPLYF